jgi:hypothetical protein
MRGGTLNESSQNCNREKTGQRFYPVFTVVKSLSAKTKPDSRDSIYTLETMPKQLFTNLKQKEL